MNQMGRMAYDTPFRYGSERSGRNQLSPRRKPMHGKRLPQRSPASGPPSKRPNFGGEKSKRKNEQRKRFSRAKKNFRRPAREETASDYEEYEMLKGPDDEVEKEKEENAQKEETMEVNGIGEKKENEGEKKEEGKKDTAEKKEPKPKFYACHICKVVAMKQDLIDQHGTTEEHKTKIETAVAQYREKKGTDSEKEKLQKQKARADNWCTVCEMAFSGHFLTHRSTPEHRRIRDKKYPKCRPCSSGFSNAEEYRDHLKTESHKMKSAEFYHFKKLPLGFDNDDEALEPVKVEEEETKEEETKIKDEPKEEAMETDNAEEKKEDGDKAEGDKEKDTDEKKDKKDSDKKAEKKQPKKPNVLGVSFVVEVDGFYCKLCRKFFKDGTVAKKQHCYSVMHYEAYKQAMEVALKDEEERQRIAEAHAQAEVEAQEAAKLAADIVTIQREARAAARKAASEKRAAKAAAEQPKEEKDEGIEMSPTDDQEKPTEVKQEAKDESSLPEKKEQTEEMCT